jgi:hypothetical protein
MVRAREAAFFCLAPPLFPEQFAAECIAFSSEVAIGSHKRNAQTKGPKPMLISFGHDLPLNVSGALRPPFG